MHNGQRSHPTSITLLETSRTTNKQQRKEKLMRKLNFSWKSNPRPDLNCLSVNEDKHGGRKIYCTNEQQVKLPLVRCAGTCVSVALIRVDWQIGHVGVGVLARRPGHHQAYQAFSFADGGDSFGMRDAGHWLLVHLPTQMRWPQTKARVLSGPKECLKYLTFNSRSPTCNLPEASATPPAVMDLTNIPRSPPITEKPRPPEFGLSSSSLITSSWTCKHVKKGAL